MLRICALFVLICAGALPAAVLADGPRGAIRVIDGDTFDVGGTRVRLHGIDAPEASQNCQTEQGVSWACGAWVSREVRARYQGKTARCVAVERDRYGRIVARCAVGGQDVGAVLVADGLAYAYRLYSMEYDLIEKQAALAQRGLWSMRVQNPAEFRRSGPQGSEPARGECRIKGNINARGERIYHRPGQADYQRTRINEAQGERWFCSAAEAEAAGWRAARR